ncbi:MAG TPA: putative Ig domain-containing protein, partial [Blastocatellia bacterium]|nr:putative Ig domain-containing protein [Blastocatellia bacterium]
YGDWATPAQVSYNIYIDSDNNGTYDRILFNSDPGNISSRISGITASGQDSFITGVFNIATSNVSTQQFLNRVSSAAVDSAVYNTNVMFLAATPASLGITAGNTFKYKVVTCPGNAPLCKQLNGFDYDEANGPYIFNTGAQGLNFSGVNLADDLNGSTLPVAWNTANMTTNGSLGALLLHHHNARGKRDEIVLLDTAQTADLAVSKSVSNVNPAFGTNVTFTVGVTNNGPNNATGVVVNDLLPSGLNYVSDDGGGAYNPSTGDWTVGALANGASATLHITVMVNTTDPVSNTALVSSSSLPDTIPDNNQATVTLMAPRSADLALQMSVSSPTVTAGSSVTYTLTVTNNGGDPAYSLSIPVSFPAFPTLTAGSFTASQGVFTPATGFWNLASLGKGGTATLSYTVTAPNTAGPLTSSATASSNINDPNTANNTASATTLVCPTITVGTPAGGALGQSYNSSVTATPAPASGFSYQYSLANSTTLPPGLTLNAITGAITGMPTADGNFSFDIKVELFDAGNVPTGCATATQTRTINVTCVSNPVVTNLNDSGAGSLRAAIAMACTGSTITFAPGLTGTITLTSGDLIIPRTLTIQGPGAQVLTISGNQQWRIFTLFNTTPASLSISGLSLRNGNGRGTVNFNQDAGGAIYYYGTPGNSLTLADLTITDNATVFAGGVYAGGNTATINVLRSTIAGNVSQQGGGLALEGNSLTANLMRSTFSGNTAPIGGGIAIRADGTVNVVNSTIAGNQATNAQGGGIGIAVNVDAFVNLVNTTITNNQGGGLQIINKATANLRNTLLALNSSGDAQFVAGGTFISSGYNLFGTGVPAGNVQPTDQVGVDPLLELDANSKPKPAFNGGPTQTIRLLPGSPAIDRGGATPFNEVQLIRLQAGSGSYSLTFNGQTTNSLPFNATAAQIQTALNALSTIGGVGGNVTVTQIPSGPNFDSVVSFGGTLSGSNQPLMTVTTPDITFISVLARLDGGPFSAQTTDQRGQSRPYDIPGIANAGGGDGSDIGAYEQECSAITLSASLPNGTANVAYNQALNPSGGFAPVTITLTAGTLPPGLAVNGNNLSGTPTATGTFNFTLTATDAYGCTGSQSYSLAFACAGVTVLPATLPGGSIGTPYNQTISTSPTGAFTFNVTSGALPTGLTLNSATGAISGTPTTAGIFNFTIQAGTAGCSGSQSYAVTIGCQTISLTPASLPAGQAGVAYSQTLSVTPAGSYAFAIVTGSLPSGLTLNASTGVISGLPSTTGSFNFTVKAQTASGCNGTQAYSLTINCPTIALSPAGLPGGNAGTAYSQQISATPSGGNYTFAVTAGALPAGLNLNLATGVISGTPSSNGSSTFTITATGFGGCTGSQAYSITIGSGGCPTITLPGSLPNGSVGALYSNSAAASPAGSYTYQLTAGALPPGVTLFANVGLVFGYPTAVGTYSFRVQATQGSCSASQDYTVQIGAGFASSLAVFSDFDGDLKSDLSLFRADGNWLVAASGNNQTQSTLWGAPYAPYYDLSVSGDYDGDGKTDLAVFRRGTEGAGYWFIKRSRDGKAQITFWGLPTDIPVPGDYDGDGKTDVAVWRASDGIWYILKSSDSQMTTIYWGTGALDDLPVPGDYDGDGKTDAAIFRRGGQAPGYWYIKRSSDGGASSTKWGLAKDLAVPGDYDGDNKTDFAVWRASEGKWYILESGSGLLKTIALGSTNDVPVAADYDGDGKADAGIWRAATGSWQFIRSSDGVAVSRTLGQSGDVPIPLRRN